MGIETANDGGLILKETCLGGVDPRKRQGLVTCVFFVFPILHVTRWYPLVISWFTIPMNTIDITPINPSEIRLICTMLAIPNWGTTARNVWVVQWFHVVRCTRCVQPGVFLQMGWWAEHFISLGGTLGNLFGCGFTEIYHNPYLDVENMDKSNIDLVLFG